MGTSTGLVEKSQGKYEVKVGQTKSGKDIMGVCIDGQEFTIWDADLMLGLIGAHNQGSEVTVEWTPGKGTYNATITKVIGGMVGTTAPATPAPASTSRGDVGLAILVQSTFKTISGSIVGVMVFPEDMENAKRVTAIAGLAWIETKKLIPEIRQFIADQGAVQITANEPPVKEDVNFVGENKAPF